MMPPKDRAKTRRKWRRWIVPITGAVQMLAADDLIFSKSMERITATNYMGPENQIYRWMLRAYANHLAMGIRRVLDTDTRTYSLLLLVRQIDSNAEIITARSFMAAPSRRGLRREGEATWEMLAGVDTDHLPAGFAAEDLRTLEGARKRLGPLLDKVFAHSERIRGRLPKRAWEEFHTLVRTIGNVCVRCNLVLTSVSPSTMQPVIEGLDGDLDDAFGRL